MSLLVLLKNETMPVISSLSSNFSVATSNTKSITLTGINFTGATAVKFGTTNAVSYTVNSATQITATVPTLTRGTYTIYVTNANATNVASPSFYAMHDYEAVPAGGLWYVGTTWAGGAAPISSSDVYIGPGSGNVTVQSVVGNCRSLDFTGYVGTFTQGLNVNIGDATAGQGNIALKLAAGMTYSGVTTKTWTFVSTSTTQQTVTWNGNAPDNVTFNGAGGSWIYQDGYEGSALLALTAGTLNLNSQTINYMSSFSTSGSNVRTLTLGAATISLLSSSTAWNATTSTNLTVTPNTATVELIGGNAIFAGGGVNYNGMTLNLTGTTTQTITGSNTFAAVTRTGGDLTLGAGTTTTASSFTMNGTAGNLRTLKSSTAASAATLAKAGGGTVDLDYLSVRDITGSPVNTWYAGANSTNVSGNTNVYFTASPAVAPTTVTATAYNDVRIDVSWTNMGAGYTYNVDWSPNGATSWNALATGTSGTSLQHNGLTASNAYYYRVFGVRSGTPSTSSTAASVATRTTPETEKVYPNAVIGGVSAGAVTDVDEAPEVADGAVLTSTTGATLTFSFAAPTGELSNGANRMKFRIRWKRP